MAEQETSQERTEEPTPKRQLDARKKGDIARSKEINTTAILMAGFGGLLLFGVGISRGLESMMRFNFQLSRADIFDVEAMGAHLSDSIMHSLWSISPVFGVLLLAAIAGPIALGGWVMSSSVMAPKWDRIDPLAGIKRMFSARSAIELFKAIAKFLLVSVLAVVILQAQQQEMLSIGKQEIMAAMGTSLLVVGWSVLALSAITLLIAAIDAPFQLWDHSRKLKMTRQEVKDEYKSTEGKPEVKTRIRQLQQEISQRRMMSAVPEADVVITNPDHYSVALVYKSDSMRAPVVVAKGPDLIAQKIRQIALANKVPLVAVPPLTRAVYYSTEIDHEIPAGLYVAVAQVLAYVFQLQRHKQGQTSKPGALPPLPIPEVLRRD